MIVLTASVASFPVPSVLIFEELGLIHLDVQIARASPRRNEAWKKPTVRHGCCVRSIANLLYTSRLRIAGC